MKENYIAVIVMIAIIIMITAIVANLDIIEAMAIAIAAALAADTAMAIIVAMNANQDIPSMMENAKRNHLLPLILALLLAP